MPFPFPRRIALVVATLGIGLSLSPGCRNPDGYDDAMTFPVRSDLIVADPISQTTPAGFNPPGHTPLDALRLPTAEATADTQQLRNEVGRNIFDPADLKPERRAEYAQLLGEMFGTPAHPKISGFDPAVLKKLDENLVPEKVIATLKLDEETLAEGSKVYRHQCLHCHGLEGNGRGPTGFWVNPHPRDYRQGSYKFTSSGQALGERKPRHEDLRHVITTGIEGTSMPSFGMLPSADVDRLISYVMYLSFRGEAEYQTMRDILKNKGDLSQLQLTENVDKPSLKQSLQEWLAVISFRWLAAESTPIQPDPYPYDDSEEVFLASAARGHQVFNSEGSGSCISCHRNYGREAPYSYDDWGTIVRPRNFYDGIFRGGKRPIDLYFRVWGGIKGVGMTSYDNTLRPNDEQKGKKIDPMWDVVNFMRALPYAELRAKLREQYKVNIE
jgi:mono/diheme cytochrome c family protein